MPNMFAAITMRWDLKRWKNFYLNFAAKPLLMCEQALKPWLLYNKNCAKLGFFYKCKLTFLFFKTH